MKAQCSVEKFKKAIINTERITGKNLTLPILSSILIIAKNKSLVLRATNLSLGIEIEIPASVETEGTVAVKGETLLQICSLIPDHETITFELKNDNMIITTNNHKLTLKSSAHDDFPTIPIVDGLKHTLPGSKFIEGIKAVYYSASLSDIKPEMASIFLYTEDGFLYFVATDSFRLAEKRVKIKHDTQFPNLLIPYKNIIEIIRIFEGMVDDITITTSKNQIAISYQGTYITSRVIDSIFPDYKQIIPKSATTEVVVLRQDFLNALKVGNIFSDKFNQISLLVSPKDKKFILSARNNDIGENETSIEATLEGEQVTMNFNYKYIIDCFQSINSDSFILKCNGAQKPLIIKGINDDSFLYLIMPMNR